MNKQIDIEAIVVNTTINGKGFDYLKFFKRLI